MWGSNIVGLGTYAMTYAQGRTADWMRIGFSPQKRYLAVYLMPGAKGMTQENGQGR